MRKDSRALVFGASGSLGSACLEKMAEVGEAFQAARDLSNLDQGAPYNSVIWAQGVNSTKNFLETSEDDWAEIMDANLHFVRRTAKLLLQNQLVENPASFVFIGSVWGDFAKTDKSAYIVSKSALQGLTRSLAIELAPSGIRVNSVLPGVVDNEMTRANLNPDQIEKMTSQTPGGRLVSPSDIASTVRFLCSEDSLGITGQSITVDGGWTIARYL
jgi:3-oxoacyl-[acyl-carrier protein] reductase